MECSAEQVCHLHLLIESVTDRQTDQKKVIPKCLHATQGDTKIKQICLKISHGLFMLYNILKPFSLILNTFNCLSLFEQCFPYFFNHKNNQTSKNPTFDLLYHHPFFWCLFGVVVCQTLPFGQGLNYSAYQCEEVVRFLLNLCMLIHL